MISLLVDECYAFDYLSILEVKKNIDPEKNKKAWEECFNYLEKQLPSLFKLIISSEEYRDLYNANLHTFNAVGKARSGGDISAKEVDDLNILRYNKKLCLQKKYFSENVVREIKL